MAESLYVRVIDELSAAVAPLIGLKDDPVNNFKELLSDLGYLPPDIFSLTGNIVGALALIAEGIKEIAKPDEEDKEFLDYIMKILPLVIQIVPKIESIVKDIQALCQSSSLQDFVKNGKLSELPRRLLDYLILHRLADGYPKAYSIMLLVGFCDQVPQKENAAAYESGCKRHVVYWEALPKLFYDPLGIPKEHYSFTGEEFNAEKLMAHLDLVIRCFGIMGGMYPVGESLAASMGGRWFPEGKPGTIGDPVVIPADPGDNLPEDSSWNPSVEDDEEPDDYYNGTENAAENPFDPLALGDGRVSYKNKEMRLPLAVSGSWPDDYAVASLALAPIATGEDDSGNVRYNGIGVYPIGAVGYTLGLTESLSLALGVEATQPILFKIMTSGFQTVLLTDGASGFSGRAFGKFTYGPAAPVTVLGFGDSFSLGFEKIGLMLEFKKDAGADPEFTGEIELGGLFIQICGGEGDGFLQKILPKDPIKAALDLTFGFSTSRKFYIKAGLGDGGVLQYTFNANLALGPILIKEVALMLRPKDNIVNFSVAATMGAELGPVKLSISKIGANIALDTSKSGNLGFADASIGFKLPEGVGISVDASVVKGGGFLMIGDGRYFGVLQLNIMDFGISVIGLLDTKDASGKPLKSGYSLLLIVCCEFTPIQLGFGFVLSGIGGLLALHRRIEIEELRTQMRSKALDYIMFPTDPVGQAPAIVESLSKIFPTEENVFVIAPMVRIGWGSPTPILKVDLSIMLELPSFNKIILLGRLGVALPEGKDPIIVIHMDAIGILQLDEGKFSLDARLYDSRIALLSLSGEMALRIGWKGNKEFLLSIGGYHPAFVAPPSFPALERLAATLSLGDWFHLRLESYFAITSNTIQFGARLDMKAKLGPIEGKGSLYFDALIYFKPFGLQVDFGMSIAVTVWGFELFAVSFDGHLSGPSPWHIWGKARFTIIGIKMKFDIEATIGKAEPPVAIDPVDAGSLLLEEIHRANNWVPLQPVGFHAVLLRETAGKNLDEEERDILLHPLGSLQFNQKTVPLGVELDKFGEAPIEGGNCFTIKKVVLGNDAKSADFDPVKEDFAAAQFFNCTDMEKLRRPSFEEYDSGFTADFSGIDFEAGALYTEFDYETIYLENTKVPIKATVAAGPATVNAPMAAALAERQLAEASLKRRELSIAAHFGAAGLSGRAIKGSRFAESEMHVGLKKHKFAVREAPPAPASSFTLFAEPGAASTGPIPPVSPGSYTRSLSRSKAAAKLGKKLDIISVWE